MENIDSFKVPFVESGVYVLRKGKEIVYIGESGNLYLRIGQHIKNGEIDFDSVEFFEIPAERRKRVESVLIQTYLPASNVQHAHFEAVSKWTFHKRLLFSLGIFDKQCEINWLKEKVQKNSVKSVISFIERCWANG